MVVMRKTFRMTQAVMVNVRDCLSATLKCCTNESIKLTRLNRL